MRCDVVEGEPGIFPAPVARIMRSIGGLFGGGRRRRPDESEARTTDAGAPGEPPDRDTQGSDDTG
jgi:hypothetical protein